MKEFIYIREVLDDSFGIAFCLLKRFFQEEDFTTPAENMGVSLSRMIDDPSSVVFLAWDGKAAIGVGTVTTSVGLEYGLSAELEDLYVIPEARGNGIASQMIEAICGWCNEQGVSVLLVTVAPEGRDKHNLLD